VQLVGFDERREVLVSAFALRMAPLTWLFVVAVVVADCVPLLKRAGRRLRD